MRASLRFAGHTGPGYGRPRSELLRGGGSLLFPDPVEIHGLIQ